MAMIPVIIRYNADWDEYYVPGPDDKERSAYYTDDKQDAIDTCRRMYENTSPPVKFTIVIITIEDDLELSCEVIE